MKKRSNWVFTPTQVDKMIIEYNTITKKFGWKAKLAQQWNFDPRNIDRFIAKIKLMKIFTEDSKTPFIKDNLKALRKGETWLKGYEELYYVNNKGVWSYPSFNKPNKLMKLQLLNSGYPILSLSDKEGNKKSFLIGRLILSTFIPVPEIGDWIVSYKDSNKTNIKPRNLYWAPLNTRQHKRAYKVDLIKDGKTLSFIGIDKARLYLKAGWGSMLKEASENNTLIKGYKVVVH